MVRVAADWNQLHSPDKPNNTGRHGPASTFPPVFVGHSIISLIGIGRVSPHIGCGQLDDHLMD
jgi:hypothetical protein